MAASNYLGIDIRIGELEKLVSDRLGRSYRLTPLSVKCTYPVFRGEAEVSAEAEPSSRSESLEQCAPSVFVKIGSPEEWRHTVRVLESVASTGLVPRMLVDECVAYRGFAVAVMEWREAKVVFPEDMTERQLESFLAGSAKLSEALQSMTEYEHVEETSRAPERLYASLAGYAKRHPLSSRAFADLLSVPAERRTFGTRKRAVIHGDYHAKNFGFRGEAFAAVFDFGQVRDGLPCSDFVNAWAERFSCLSMDAQTRRRLRQQARDAFSRVPWARDDMEVAVNMLRLQFAARRIEKHPDSFWVALDIRRRDRKICEILSCMEGRR